MERLSQTTDMHNWTYKLDCTTVKIRVKLSIRQTKWHQNGKYVLEKLKRYFAGITYACSIWIL